MGPTVQWSVPTRANWPVVHFHQRPSKRQHSGHSQRQSRNQRQMNHDRDKISSDLNNAYPAQTILRRTIAMIMKSTSRYRPILHSASTFHARPSEGAQTKRCCINVASFELPKKTIFSQERQTQLVMTLPLSLPDYGWSRNGPNGNRQNLLLFGAVGMAD